LPVRADAVVKRHDRKLADGRPGREGGVEVDHIDGADQLSAGVEIRCPLTSRRNIANLERV